MSVKAILAAGAFALSGTGIALAETQLNMGGSTNTSAFFPYYTAIANAISADAPDLNVTVVSSGGLAKNGVLLQRGELDFASLSPDLISDAEARGYDGFRTLWWSIPAIQNMMATEKSGITGISGFAGHCFHPGMNGSSGQKTMLNILKVLDIKPDLYMSDSGDAINAIKSGRCDGQMKATTALALDAASAELNLTTPLKGVGYDQAQMQAIKAAIPWISFTEMPADTARNDQPYFVHSIWIGFVTTRDLPEQTGYEIVRGMVSGLEEQRLALKYLNGVDIIRQTLEVADAPLHAGAVRFFREQGYDVPDALVPPEMK
ncbi:TAXI family TRAP transporter solute-binding subunit [Paracoccus sp. (in: a-proteobacteria)]|uniref:TAXI family TRAP transporter solute-binding subunit n=1 Tax=Paracoccus sp. TaxID=267 RepID=UPI003A8BF4FA